MRADVKLGVALSLVIVFIAGGYYMIGRNEEPVPLAGDAKDALTQGKSEDSNQAGRTNGGTLRDSSKAETSDRRNGGQSDRRRASRTNLPSRGREAADGGVNPSAGRRMNPASAGVDQETNGGTSAHSNVAATHRESRPSQDSSANPGGTASSQLGQGGAGERTVNPGAPGSTSNGVANVADNGPSEAGDAADQERGAGTGSNSSHGITYDGGSGSRSNYLTGHSAGAATDATASGGTGGARPAYERPGLRSTPRIPPAGNPSVRQEVTETHRVQPGDTFSSLAKSYYGHERYTQFLIKSNPQIAAPSLLLVGQLIKIPPAPVEEASPGVVAAAATATGRTYTVQAGDTFYGIAQKVLGRGSRWEELFELNKDLVGGDPKRLQVGQVLRLPQSK